MSETTPAGELRLALRDARRVVVKVGSRSLLQAGAFERLTADLMSLRTAGKEVVLVSSGAVALGVERLGLSERPRAIAPLQAAASAGQAALLRQWESALEPHHVCTSQILLTHADLADRERWRNARRAIDALIELGSLPVINENDAVSVEEIRFGDNDQLAAMVATLVSADLLVLLTNVEGLLDDDAARVPVVRTLAEVRRFVKASSDRVGSGGMGSKLDAAHRATRRGVPVVIADAREAGIVGAVVAGDDVGTLVLPEGAALPSRKHWIAYTLRPKGALVLDRGAIIAVRASKSLLAVGVLGVRGEFEAGDCVSLLDADGVEFARGLARSSVAECARLAGERQDLSQDAGVEADSSGNPGRSGRGRSGKPGVVLVHSDDLVVISSDPAGDAL